MRSWDRLSYGITQCYLPSDRGDSHAFTPTCCRYSFMDHGRTKGWVDLGGWWPWWFTQRRSPIQVFKRAWCRVTTLIETNALPLSQATTEQHCCGLCSCIISTWHGQSISWFYIQKPQIQCISKHLVITTIQPPSGLLAIVFASCVLINTDMIGHISMNKA